MAAQSKKVYNLAVLLFTGADITDFSGPLEMLCHTLYNFDPTQPEHVFKPTLIAGGPTVVTGECMTIQADMTIADALAKVNDFDVLLVPGAWPTIVLEMCKNNSRELELIEAFNKSPSPASNTLDEKVIFSVCTGSLFLSHLGILAGLKATTHHMSLDQLREMDNSIEVISSISDDGKPKRYVDGGINKQGKRVVTAGGITCGVDAALYVAELKAGRQAPEFTAKMSEHEWKRVEV